MSRSSTTRRLVALAGAAAAALAAGCAVQTARDGAPRFMIDYAEALGRSIGSFKLADGSQGTLRDMGRDLKMTDGSVQMRFSLKLERYLKVLPIADATGALLVSTGLVGDRTLVVIQKAERGCAAKTTLLSIRGAEVLSWDVWHRDCRTEPTVAVTGDRAVIDFGGQTGGARYVYREARLFEEAPPRPAPQVPDAPPTQPTPGPVAEPSPRKAGAEPAARPRPAAAQPGARPARPATAGPPLRPPAPPPTRVLDFSPDEKKPVRIVLDG